MHADESVSPTESLGNESASASAIVRQDLDHMWRGLNQELEILAGKKLLITGGAGFLGYYLVQLPLYWNTAVKDPRQIRVTVFDNFARGVPEWLENLRGAPNLELVRHDIAGPLPPATGDYDYIIHAASIASPLLYRRYPIETMDANVNGLRTLLDHCRRQEQSGTPIGGFLFFSTSEIYGDPDAANIPTPETYRGNVSCTGPRACYDESKRYGETLCVNFARVHGLPIKVARPFNNYGPGLKITDRRVIADFSRDVLEGRDIVMLSDGRPTRTYCYAADAVIGYYKILTRGRAGEAYNIGTESPEISIADLADRIVALSRDLFSYSGRVVRRTSADPDYLTDNPGRRCPMIAKARSELGYSPDISLDEGLRRSLVWYQGNRQAEDG
jgi:UDP-glucuronate decarboxylase